MKIAVLTPTRLPGGLDVNAASLCAQSRKPDLWIIVDALYAKRALQVKPYLDALPFPTFHVSDPPAKPGTVRNLAAAYNAGLDAAVAFGADLVVSMQDYFWIPSDGIERFEYQAERGPLNLYSGLASLSNDPYRAEVIDPEGAWTIYGRPWRYQRPMDIRWEDCRGDVMLPVDGRFRKASQMRRPFVYDAVNWETNWAAIPGPLLDLRFDESYDTGVAYENQAFAAEAVNTRGAQVIVDPGNHAIGLPHKAYWPELEAAEAPLSILNRERHEARMAEKGWHP